MECPKCGEKLHDYVDYCDACGCDLKHYNANGVAETRVYSGENEGFMEYRTAPPVGAQKLKRKKDKKGALVSLIIVVSMLLVLFLVGAFVYRNVHKTPYEKRIDDMLSVLSGDVTTVEDFMEALFPEFLCEDYEALMKAECEDNGQNYEETMADTNSRFASQWESFLEKQNFNEYELTYSVNSERKLGEAELKDISESYTTASQILNVLTTTGESYKTQNKIKTYDAYMKLIEDFTSIECSEGYEMEIEFVATNKVTDERDKETMKLILVKIDGDWMIDYMHYIDELSTYFGIN